MGKKAESNFFFLEQATQYSHDILLKVKLHETPRGPSEALVIWEHIGSCPIAPSEIVFLSLMWCSTLRDDLQQFAPL